MEPMCREMLSQEFDYFISRNRISLPPENLADFFIQKGVKMILDRNVREVALNKIKLATDAGCSWGRTENEAHDKKKRKVESEEKDGRINE
jgi:hypothetical protein